MAMIDKIRSKGWLVIVVVGLGLILFLMPPDAMTSLFGGGSNPTIGKIDGNTITLSDWNELLRKRKLMYRNNSNVANLSNMLWDDYVEQNLLAGEYDELGLFITDEEFEGVMYGENLSPTFKSIFYNNVDSLPLREQQRTYMETEGVNNPEWYAEIMAYAKNRRIKEKYNNLLKKGMYANKIDGKRSYEMANTTRSIEYVVKTYAEVGDSLVAYNDSDLRAYYNKHKKDEEWKIIEDSRVLEYVAFSVLPSAEDSMAVKQQLEALKAPWAAAMSDSLFVSANSLGGVYAKLKYTDGDFAGPENANIVGDSIGSIIGPYADGNFIRIVKILGRGLNTKVDSVHVRHILLDDKQDAIPHTVLRTKADSLKKVILKEKNFEEMVTKFSEDPGSKSTGGKYWVPKGKMVAPFEKASFEGKKGDLQIVDTDFGIHILEILEYDPQVLETEISIIDREISSSDATRRRAKSQALLFSSSYKDSVSFRNAADTMGLAITPVAQLRRTDQQVAGLQTVGDMVSWTFNSDTEIGQVSAPISVDDKLVVCLLLDKKEKGAPSYENVKDKVRREVLNEKKAEYIIALAEPGNNLQEVATALTTAVKKGDNMKMSTNSLPGSSGNEYEAVGTAFGLPDNYLSKPIKGKNGVYVIGTTAAAVKAPEKESFLEEQNKMITNLQSRAGTSPYVSMKDNARIVDKRFGE